MTRDALENNQVLVYLVAVVAGLGMGQLFPQLGQGLESVLWPLLALLLYTTFTQVPLVRLREALGDLRFLVIISGGNFLVLPLVVWCLMLIAPQEPGVRVGVLLVLLVPCTDWFITFCQRGGGSSAHAMAFSPVSLVLQIVLLPLYLWLFLGPEFKTTFATGEMLKAFVGLILLPLFCAWLSERWASGVEHRARWLERLGWVPVPLLALVIFVIVLSQVGVVAASVTLLARLVPIFVGFLLIVVLLSWLMARLLRLEPLRARVLAFSFGTRNSFMVLPLALALPEALEIAVVVIVFQSLVELLGMIILIWYVPKHLFPGQE